MELAVSHSDCIVAYLGQVVSLAMFRQKRKGFFFFFEGRIRSPSLASTVYLCARAILSGTEVQAEERQ